MKILAAITLKSGSLLIARLNESTREYSLYDVPQGGDIESPTLPRAKGEAAIRLLKLIGEEYPELRFTSIGSP